ncbi:MAG: hypothetical protein JWQ87_5191 [Candidatus Sulfotelmatobacter sp.]|nr:hypothetical protein [Candidatus Sulfotelmatobacter sp.]
MSNALAPMWYEKFMETVQRHESSPLLKDSAIRGQLGNWTTALTGVVCSTCEAMGWKAAAKGNRSTLLPIARQEYLALDVVAFEPAGDRRWRFPIAAIELENKREDDFVAYSLWKVLCTRADLRIVFCYRKDSAKGVTLVRHLSEQVATAMEIQKRSQIGGETMLIVGSKNESATFPYGFFKEWQFDTNLGRFGRV